MLRNPNVINLHDEVDQGSCLFYCRLAQEQILRNMGVGIRIFIVNDADSFQRLSLLKLQRLVRGDLNERIEKFAGKRMRYVEVLLKIANRNPKEIFCIQYGFFHFDSKGLIDASEREEEVRLVLEALPSLPADVQSSKVIPAKHIFARKQYEDRYKWVPTAEIESAIEKAVFSKSSR